MDSCIDRLRTHHILSLCVMGLLFIGLLMVQSASMSVSGDLSWHWSDLAGKHLLFVSVALIVYFVVGSIDYRRLFDTRTWRNVPIAFYLAALFLCVLVLIPGIGKEVNGARRWIDFKVIQLQPSELAKWATVIFYAWWLTRRPVNLDKFWTGFVPTLIPVGTICLLVVIQDFGTAALIGLCTMMMLVTGRIKLWHLMVTFPPAVAAAAIAIAIEPYRLRRMTAFLDPWSNPREEGYHMIQSLLSFSTGGMAGRGLGNGIQKLGYLPEDTTDFIFAVICEELGFFGALLTIGLYVAIIWVVWQTIKDARDSLGRVLAFGVGAMISLQAIINIAVATVSVPPKGMPLPLISAGGTGLIITCGALGILMSVCRHQNQLDDLPLADKSFRPLQRHLRPV